jgi:hypothetical protein
MGLVEKCPESGIDGDIVLVDRPKLTAVKVTVTY